MLRRAGTRRGQDNRSSGGGESKAATSRNTADDDDRGMGKSLNAHVNADFPPSTSSNRKSRKGTARGGGGGGEDLRNSTHTMTSTIQTASTGYQQQKERSIYDSLPQEYQYNPKSAEPALHYLPRALNSNATAPTATRHKSSRYHDNTNNNNNNSADNGVVSLRNLLRAAEQDVRLHRARVQAGLQQDLKLVRTYQLETDPEYQSRLERLAERHAVVQELQAEQQEILQNLENAEARGLTLTERTQLQLARWERALQLYVYAPNAELDWQSLFEKLLEGVGEEQDISQVLADAGNMCLAVVDYTKQSVMDAAENVTDVESSYVVRLEAHQMFARSSLDQVAEIEDQFKSSGRAALQIGHQLEHAELKRSQCEAASVLIRRWWILENLAEQEVTTGQLVNVQEEVRGLIPPTACKMDALFTKPENSLEAANALKQLRAVVRSRGSAASSSSASTGVGDKTSSRRFQVTGSLITRTSDALEQRLLNSFSEVYSAGGMYDFSHKPRHGAIDWRELRALAQALLLFDSGRSLHKRYVDMVVTSRFPELFQAKDKQGEDVDEDDEETDESFDMDATRSKLSSLFHRVSEVCTAEFELIAHVFGAEGSRTDLLDGSEEMPLVVARALLQRVVSDPKHGLQARINDLLASIDRKGDFDAGAKKLDTFVVIHEKAAGLFGLLKDAAENMVPDDELDSLSPSLPSARNAVESLKGFLTSQELALSNTHRQGYINLELRLLHHDCCSSLDQAGCALVKATPPRPDSALAEKGILEEYRAPVLPLHKQSLALSGYTGILAGPLKQSVLRQPLIHATDSLGRARLMFGTSKRGGETTARVILSIYSQMCSFYGEGFLYPIVETLREMLPTSPPVQPPQLPFDEVEEAPDLGVSPAFWVALERVHSASKSFDRELWAENRSASERVWESFQVCGDAASMTIAREERIYFYSELERRGEAAILRALDTLSTHIQWVLVTGGESMLATGGTRIFNQLTGQSGGPYAIPAGSSLETPNSPAVKSCTYSLRVQFVHVQAALTAPSLAKFWTALSMRLYDILVTRLLQHYYVSTVGAVILSRDVEALRSVAMLAGTDHSHWDMLRELLTLYMTPPDAIKTMLIGPEGDSSKGLFSKAGRDQCLVVLSRRNDYRYKTASGPKKSGWVIEMLKDLNMTDPSDGAINIGLFAAGRSG